MPRTCVRSNRCSIRSRCPLVRPLDVPASRGTSVARPSARYPCRRSPLFCSQYDQCTGWRQSAQPPTPDRPGCVLLSSSCR
ncbi:hypothetical protein SEA_ENNEA_86 [Gordonia phage Ennea]|nr:hypothetical protein SEA_ENNEA_86 [Gordonia phage Ennea]